MQGADRHLRLRQGEKFGGLLIPMMDGSFGPTEQEFKAMNQCLKRRAED